MAATLAISGCGSATNISGDGAHLTKATFASAVSKATSQVTSLHMTMKLGAAGQNMTMTSDVAIDDPAAIQNAPVSQALQHMSMSLQATLAGRSIQMRMIHGVMYVEASGLGMVSTPGKPWTKISLNGANNPMSQVLGSMGSFDPSQISKAFRGLTTLTKIGSGTVNGVSATHYRATLDTAKAASLLGGAAGSSMASLPKTLTYDVWVDSQARPVEISVNLPQGSMQMLFSRWNQPVHIVAPPASQVSTLTH